mgnify:CR=1 FL=1
MNENLIFVVEFQVFFFLILEKKTLDEKKGNKQTKQNIRIRIFFRMLIKIRYYFDIISMNL